MIRALRRRRMRRVLEAASQRALDRALAVTIAGLPAAHHAARALDASPDHPMHLERLRLATARLDRYNTEIDALMGTRAALERRLERYRR